MTKALIYASAMIVAAWLAGCRTTAAVDYAGKVHVTSSELIQIAPGVQVVADADEPLFFADGVYWLYRNGYWFRDSDLRGDFARADFSVVPEQLRGLERPEGYAHYRREHERTRAARPSPTRTRSQPQAPTSPPSQAPTPPPSQAPTSQPPAPTPEPVLPSQTSEPTAPPPPYPPPPEDRPARPTSPPGNAVPVQPGDELDRPAPSTDDASDETKRIDEKKDPDTTDE